MNKKPKIFKPDMSFVDNNKKTYCSFIEEKEDSKKTDQIKRELNKEDVESFINKLSNTNSYVFNKKIVIVTDKEKEETRIAGKIGNRLITLDNKSINIDDIIDIYEKE